MHKLFKTAKGNNFGTPASRTNDAVMRGLELVLTAGKDSQHSNGAYACGRLRVAGIGRQLHLADLVAMHLVGPVREP
jgi:hypothetical protein